MLQIFSACLLPSFPSPFPLILYGLWFSRGTQFRLFQDQRGLSLGEGQGYLGTSSHMLAFRLSCQGEIGIGLSCSDLEVLHVYIQFRVGDSHLPQPEFFQRSLQGEGVCMCVCLCESVCAYMCMYVCMISVTLKLHVKRLKRDCYSPFLIFLIKRDYNMSLRWLGLQPDKTKAWISRVSQELRHLLYITINAVSERFLQNYRFTTRKVLFLQLLSIAHRHFKVI